MKKKFGGVVLDISIRLIVPFSMMYAVYVLAAGEEGPGGGFQAGAVLALGLVFGRLSNGGSAKFRLAGPTAVAVAGVGTFIYVLTGWLSMFNGGTLLEYGKLPLGLGYEELHSWGIFLIEFGVTICVMMTIVNILEALLKREDFEDD